MGLFDGIWATSVAIKAMNHHGINVDFLSENHRRTLKLIAVSLKDKGMSKQQALDAINELAIKHGGLMRALGHYSEIFGCGENS